MTSLQVEDLAAVKHYVTGVVTISGTGGSDLYYKPWQYITTTITHYSLKCLSLYIYWPIQSLKISKSCVSLVMTTLLFANINISLPVCPSLLVSGFSFKNTRHSGVSLHFEKFTSTISIQQNPVPASPHCSNVIVVVTIANMPTVRKEVTWRIILASIVCINMSSILD